MKTGMTKKAYFTGWSRGLKEFMHIKANSVSHTTVSLVDFFDGFKHKFPS